MQTGTEIEEAVWRHASHLVGNMIDFFWAIIGGTVMALGAWVYRMSSRVAVLEANRVSDLEKRKEDVERTERNFQNIWSKLNVIEVDTKQMNSKLDTLIGATGYRNQGN